MGFSLQWDGFWNVAYPNATKLDHQPKNVEKLNVNHGVPYTWPLFNEQWHDPIVDLGEVF